MRPFDLIFLSAENLGRRKGRALLTAVGVVIGTGSVVILISLGMGLQRNANSQLVGIGDLTLIQVYQGYGAPSMGSGPIVGPGEGPGEIVAITDQAISEMAALPGVVGVFARDYPQGEVRLNFERWEGYAQVMGVEPNSLEALGLRASQGQLALERGQAVIGASVKQNFFVSRPRPGEESVPPADLMDRSLKLTLIKWSPDSSTAQRSYPIHVVGVLTTTASEPDWTIYVPMADVEAMNQWVTGKRPNRMRDGYPSAVVKVADVSLVEETYDQIRAMGFEAHSPQSFVQGINGFFLVMQIIFGGVGATALLVAAIGIANTMTMSVLERTREIGLMKAVGATNREVLGVFLLEAAGVGFLGGLGGVAIGWSLGQLLNVIALAFLAGQAVQNGAPPPTVAVYTPVWLPVSSLIFSGIIGVLSGLYPALRAATMEPVLALKHE